MTVQDPGNSPSIYVERNGSARASASSREAPSRTRQTSDTGSPATTQPASTVHRERKGDRPDPTAEPIQRRWYRAARRWWWRCKHPLVRRRLRHTVVEEIDGIQLVIPPGVHNPVLFRAGAFLARTTARMTAVRRLDVLDVGTGSGLIAIVAAQNGCRVVGVDINPRAVRCARANAALNGVEDNLTIEEGDLFDPVRERQFDLVSFNPPFFVGRPANTADMAWRSADVLARFAAGLPAVLKPDGLALVVFSSDGDEETLHEVLHRANGVLEELDWQDLGNEVLTVYSVSFPSRTV